MVREPDFSIACPKKSTIVTTIHWKHTPSNASEQWIMWRIFSRNRPTPSRLDGALVLFNGMVTNDKFCLIRRCQVQLRWSRQPYRSRPRKADDLLDETSHREGSHETPLADTAAIPANGGWGAAMGSGIPIPAALDDTDRAVHRVRPISHTTGGGDA
jgi:hypothetical protein